MKKLTFLFSLFLLASVASEMQAQVRGWGFRPVFDNYIEPSKPVFNYGKALSNSKFGGLEVSRFETFDEKSKASWVVPLKVSSAKFPIRRNPNNLTDNQLFANLDALIRWSFVKPTRMLVPYIQFGLGGQYNFKSKRASAQLPLGAGLNFRLTKKYWLSLQTEYRPEIAKKSVDGIVTGLGLLVDLGPKDPDTDGDGIKDSKDKCPSVPGLAAFEGCPDTDGDGIQDSMDDCPTEPGKPELKGCPDQDGDGIADKMDACPTEAGLAAFNGCPDTDMDGLMDKDDKCPKEKGPKENAGCPWPDRDGDGVLDKDDACPSEKGLASLKGCPDRDGDGLADKDDKCPDQAGPISNKGCPEMKVEEKKKLEFAMRAVQFETGKSVILKQSYPVLDEIATILAGYPDYNLRVEGHTDNVGDPVKNQKLSEARAKACVDYLVTKGLAANRMVSAGFGETRPMADNKTKAGRDLNRRVEFNTFLK